MKTYRFSYLLILSLVLTIGSAMLKAQQAKNVVLADFVSTEELYKRQSPFPYGDQNAEFPIADLWGWTYNGEEYALVCLGSKSVSGSGLAMVKVTDPNKFNACRESFDDF